MVKVKYLGVYRHSFGIEEEEIAGKTLRDVIKNVETKYKGKTFANTI